MNMTTTTTTTTNPIMERITIRIPGWLNIRKDAKVFPIIEFPFRQRPRANAYVSDTDSESDEEE